MEIPKSQTRRYVPHTTMLEPAMLQQIRDMATTRHVSCADVIRALLTDALTRTTGDAPRTSQRKHA